MNFKHLHYFWVTAKAGGIVRAGAQLHTTPQTLSGQIKLLESSLGLQLFRKKGRQLELTDDGRLALGYAEQIFALGAEMETALKQAQDKETVLEFRVGVTDSVAKSVVYQLLEPALSMPQPVRLICWRNWGLTGSTCYSLKNPLPTDLISRPSTMRWEVRP